MKKSIVFLILFLSGFGAYAQDELMLRGDTTALNFDLRIKKLGQDTIVYKAYGKEKFYLAEQVMAYRYKDSLWTFVKKADKEKFVIRQGVLRLKHLQPDIIMKPYELKPEHIRRIKKLPAYKAKIPYKDKTKTLVAGTVIMVSLYGDTTHSGIVMPLSRISNDSLFFIADLYKTTKLYGVNVREIRYVILNLPQYSAGGLMGAVFYSIPENSARATKYMVDEGIIDASKRSKVFLKESDWTFIPVK